MGTEKPRNPDAFPNSWMEKGTTESATYGMSLRDYFAAQAISGLVVAYRFEEPVTLVDKAFKIADEMLKKRLL